MSRPKTGSASCYSKKILPVYVKMVRHTDKAVNVKCGQLLQDCASSQTLPAKCQTTQYKVCYILSHCTVPRDLLWKRQKTEEEEGKRNLSQHRGKPMHW